MGWSISQRFFHPCVMRSNNEAAYIAAQKSAGSDKIIQEVQKQVDAYLASEK